MPPRERKRTPPPAQRDPRQRFVPKERLNGTWGVYDWHKGSWPALRPGLGAIRQDHSTQEQAQREADRLEEHYRKESS